MIQFKMGIAFGYSMAEDCCDHDHGPEGHVHVKGAASETAVLEAELILDDGIIPPPSTEESSPVETFENFSKIFHSIQLVQQLQPEHSE